MVCALLMIPEVLSPYFTWTALPVICIQISAITYGPLCFHDCLLTIQKVTFCVPKGYLLQSKRPSFTVQKVIYWVAKDDVMICYRFSFVSFQYSVP